MPWQAGPVSSQQAASRVRNARAAEEAGTRGNAVTTRSSCLRLKLAEFKRLPRHSVQSFCSEVKSKILAEEELLAFWIEGIHDISTNDIK